MTKPYIKQTLMRTFRHILWSGRREYRDCTQVVAIRAESAPDANWVPCEASELPASLTRLQIVAGVEYWGWL